MYKNLLRNTLLAATFSLVSVFANATLITQDILFDDLTTADVVFETIGSITVETDNADAFGLIGSWETFNLFGFDMITEADSAGDITLFGGFEAIVDEQNLAAGIEFLFFDVTESNFEFFNFSGLVDTAFGGNYLIDVFDFGGGLYAYGDLALGTAKVSEPPMFLLFFSGLMVLFLKRRKA
jgi:hypothetical protein